jgi:CRP-like cAMP-binding protein
LVDQIRSLHPPSPEEVNREVPSMLSQICMRMLQKEPADRYPDFHAVLRDLSSFRGVGEAFPQRDYASGEIIFNEGEPGDFAFMILVGQVEILKQLGEPAPRVIATLGVGEVVGELAIISKLPRSAGARARGPTRIRILSQADIENEMRKLSPWVSKMITGLSSRFLQLRDRLLESERKPPTG